MSDKPIKCDDCGASGVKTMQTDDAFECYDCIREKIVKQDAIRFAKNHGYAMTKIDIGPGYKEIGEKLDAGRPDYSLLPFDALEGVVEVLTFGADKYERDNWRRVHDARNRYYAAAQRHMTAHMRGETADAESGLDHLDHALCCLLFMSQLSKEDEA